MNRDAKVAEVSKRASAERIKRDVQPSPRSLGWIGGSGFAKPIRRRGAMRRASFVVLLAILASPISYAASYSQIAMGAGSECTIILNNKLGSQFTGALDFRKGNGEAWSSRQVTIAPYASFNITYSGTPAEVQAGYLEVVGTGASSANDVAVVVFYNFYSGGRLVDSIGIPRGEMSSGHIFAVQKSATINTALAWSRFDPTAPFDITLTLYGYNGAVITQKTVSFTGHMAKYFDEIFGSVPMGLVGYVRVVSPQPISMTVLRFETVGDVFQLTATPSTTFTP